MKKSNVSVVVATFNPKLNELKKTIKSIIFQEDVAVEVVITDDGSSHFPYDEIVDFMSENDFSNYKIVCNKENKGTVCNLLAGISESSGEFIKLISPGDCLSSTKALFYLAAEIKKNNSDFSFGEVVYYWENSEVFTIKKHYSHPQNLSPYVRSNQRLIWYNYLVLNDTIHGVSTLCKKEVLKKYLNLAEGKVIYAEDTLYRVMVNDGINISYCPEIVALYSFGGGISTQKNTKWQRLIKKDLCATDQMIIKKIKKRRDRLLFKFSVELRDRKNFWNYLKISLVSPAFLIGKLRCILKKRYSPVSITDDFYKRCCS